MIKSRAQTFYIQPRRCNKEILYLEPPGPSKPVIMEANQRSSGDTGSQSSVTHTHASLSADPSWITSDELPLLDGEWAKLGLNEYGRGEGLPSMSREEQAVFEDVRTEYEESVMELACDPDGSTAASCMELGQQIVDWLKDRAHPERVTLMTTNVIPDIFFAYFTREEPTEPVSATSMEAAVQHLTQIQRVLEGDLGGKIRNLKQDFELPDDWMERLENARVSVGYPNQLDGPQTVTFLALVRQNILCKAKKEGPPKDITSVQSTDGSGLNPPHIS